MRYLFLALVACVAAAPSRPQLVLDDNDGRVGQVAFPRPGPPPVVDLSKYTIAQVRRAGKRVSAALDVALRRS